MMDSRKLKIFLPPAKGISKTVSIPISETGSDQMVLSSILESQGIRLNTRCGSRGLCQGCLIEIKSGQESPVIIKACCRTVASLPKYPVSIRIPESSLRDMSLKGVSEFEITPDFFGSPKLRSGIGLALDAGTTTVAGALWNLADGQCLATSSRANAQIRFGDNVLTRISHAIEGKDGLADLQRSLVADSLNPLIEDLCLLGGVQRELISESTVSGNPTMLHTLAGCSVQGFSHYPFKPEFLESRLLEAETIGLNLKCSLHLLPSIGPWVGSDIVAGMLASGLDRQYQTALLIDFGTNGEIVLKTPDGFLVAATAAGPAFEGGRLTCGATARPGVITHLLRSRGEWKILLVDGNTTSAPQQIVGMSGAAYIDFMALGHEEGWLNEIGRFDHNHEIVSHHLEADKGDEKRVCLTDQIYVTEPDIAELLQAKAAIAGGVATLLDMAGLIESDLERVFVAGGFGYHLNPGHASTVGLLPRVEADRIHLIGNSSLGGASLILLHQLESSLVDLIRRCRHIELNQVPAFQDHFTDALLIGE